MTGVCWTSIHLCEPSRRLRPGADALDRRGDSSSRLFLHHDAGVGHTPPGDFPLTGISLQGFLDRDNHPCEDIPVALRFKILQFGADLLHLVRLPLYMCLA